MWNPVYPGISTGFPGAVGTPLVPAKGKTGFYAALEESVRRGGIRNPPVLYIDGHRWYVGFGGSRVLVAQRLGLGLPAIVNAGAGAQITGKGVVEVTEDNWSNFFVDPPAEVEWSDRGFQYHYSIERNRRDRFDPQGLKWTEELDDTKFLDEEFSWLNR